MNFVSGPGFGPGFGFGMFGVLFSLCFLLVLGIILVTLVKSIGQWNQNNHSPRLTVPATVAAKRTHVSRRGGANGHRRVSASYYVTFQVESGDRMELHVSGQEYGLLVEGDRGTLRFQGTRYLGFERI